MDILSTHLDVIDDEHDLHCLVLLSSVARYVEYSDIGFVLEYYYKLAETEEVNFEFFFVINLEFCEIYLYVSNVQIIFYIKIK